MARGMKDMQIESFDLVSKRRHGRELHTYFRRWARARLFEGRVACARACVCMSVS